MDLIEYQVICLLKKLVTTSNTNINITTTRADILHHLKYNKFQILICENDVNYYYTTFQTCFGSISN